MKPSLIIIGLGNPGASYERTRHNAGFLAVDELSGAFGAGEWGTKQKFQSLAQEARVLTAPILLIKPQTYMNLSGQAVRKVIDFYHLDPKKQLLVISDDVDIPLETLRFRESGGPGTHNGMKSLVEQFGEGFPRFRIGIGPLPSGQDLAAWVLSRFSQEEEEKLRVVLAQVPEHVRKFVMGENLVTPARPCRSDG